MYVENRLATLKYASYNDPATLKHYTQVCVTLNAMSGQQTSEDKMKISAGDDVPFMNLQHYIDTTCQDQ